MSRQPHHTTPPLPEQLAQLLEHDWQAVVERLPSDYESQAEQLGALVRKREVRRASDLLRALLAYVLCAPSFRQLGCWAVLAGPRLPDLPAGSRGHGRVLLIDATRLKEPGGTGDDWRLHTAYDLRAGRLVQVSLSDQHGVEALERFVLQPGDVAVADAGYGYRHCVVWVLCQQADVVVRIHPRAFPVLDEHGQPLDVVAWLKQVHEGQHSRQVSFVWHEQTYQVRLIACSLSPEAAERAREAKRKKASKMQRQLKEQTLFLAGWVLLITSLPVLSWSTEQVLALYRARWQIELVYKRMKQVLHLNQLRGMRPETNEASILALLVAWALHEQEAQQARARLAEAAACWQAETAPAAHPGARTDEEGTSAESGQEPPVSSWLLTAVCLQTLRTVVQGYWSLERLRACLPEQQRFLRGSPRKRQHQERFIRALLLELRGPDPCLE